MIVMITVRSDNSYVFNELLIHSQSITVWPGRCLLISDTICVSVCRLELW